MSDQHADQKSGLWGRIVGSITEQVPDAPLRVEDGTRAVSAHQPDQPAPPQGHVDPKVEAIFRKAAEPALGEAYREYQSSDEALVEAIPDRTMRHKAVVKLLARKQISLNDIATEIDAAILAVKKKGDESEHAMKARYDKVLEQHEAVQLQFETDTRDSQDRIKGLQGQIVELQRQIGEEEAKMAQARQQHELNSAAIEQANRNLQTQEANISVTYAHVVSDLETTKRQFAEKKES